LKLVRKRTWDVYNHYQDERFLLMDLWMLKLFCFRDFWVNIRRVSGWEISECDKSIDNA
jgi:hypothetical protein